MSSQANVNRSLELIQSENIDLEDTTFCARLDFPDTAIADLADSIKENGLRNPPAYVKNGNRLSVLFGWRRTLAIKKLGWTEYEGWVYPDLDLTDAHFHNLNDNLERENLTVLELAKKVSVLRGLDIPIEDIGQRIKKGTQHIYDLLKLCEMEQDIQNAVHSGDISLYKAIEIYKFPISKRLETLSKTIGERLSVSRLKQIRRDENPPRISESTQAHIQGIVVKAQEQGVEIKYEDVEAHLLSKEKSLDGSINSSRRFWKVSGGWAVEVPYDWKEGHEKRLGMKLRSVVVTEQEDGSLLIKPKGGSDDV